MIVLSQFKPDEGSGNDTLLSMSLNQDAGFPVTKPRATTDQSLKRFSRIETLVELGAADVSQLEIKLNAATDADEAFEIADALVEIGSPEAIQVFAEYWLSAKGKHRKAALGQSLRSLDSDDGLEMVASILALTDDKIILNAVNDTVSRMADQETLDFLAELYQEGADEENGLRTRVVETVQSIANPAAVDALAQLVKDSDSPEMALAAADSLRDMGTEPALASLVEAVREEEQRREIYDPLLRKLASVESENCEALLQAVAESDPLPDIREAASEALEAIRSADFLDPETVSSSVREIELR